MLLLCLFFTSAVMTISRISACPDKDVCSCTETVINCTCEIRKNITVDPLYRYGIRQIVIKGCGVVVINPFSIYHLSLEKFELTDLEQLSIRGFALSRLQTVENFLISNVHNMEVDHYGFSTLYNINTLSISNVSWQNVWKESFGGVSTVENFIITDSEFKNVKPHALILHNITKFHVKNSHFETVENRSLLLHSAKEVLFENCTFAHTKYSIFSMSFIEVLSFQRCSFDELETSAFFVDEVESFTMSNCTVNNLKDRAFQNIRVLRRIHFTDNVINHAEEGSLFFNTDYVQDKNYEKNLSGNRIVCTCSLSWLWENLTDIYRNFIENSFCMGSSSNVKISSLSAIIRSKSECTKLNDTLFGTENNDSNSTSALHTVSGSRTSERDGVLYVKLASEATKKCPLYVACYLLMSLWVQLCY